MTDVERNWARNVTYRAPVRHPETIEQLQQTVAAADRVHALGTRHSFSTCADSDGLLVALDRIPAALEVDAAAGTATVGSAIRLGDLGRLLDEQGLAIANLPSLPHISLGGSVATATHGSGDALGMLATFVRGLEVVGPDGALRRVRGDELAGAVLSYGALGVVTRITVAVEPAFTVRQDAFSDLPWSSVEQHLDEIFGSGYSVSLFTRWTGDVRGALVKSREAIGPAGSFFGGTPTPVDPAEIQAVTKSTEVGAPGPSWDRLPHFRLAAVPSVGEELQSEYFVPRAAAADALAALRAMGDDIDRALHVTELRTVAADDLWLSPASGTDVLAIGFTWRDAPDLVHPLLPRIEERLLPLGARPHWAKLFAARGERLRALHPRWDDFLALRDAADPDRVFGNPFLEDVLRDDRTPAASGVGRRGGTDATRGAGTSVPQRRRRRREEQSGRMTWTTDESTRLADAEELRVAGRREDGSLRRLVTIWAVVVDDVLYARSVRGPEGGWYRGVQQRHEGRIESGGVERDVVFTDVPAEDAVQDAIDAAYIAKYPRYAESVDDITTAAARGTTLRIDPA